MHWFLFGFIVVALLQCSRDPFGITKGLQTESSGEAALVDRVYLATDYFKVLGIDELATSLTLIGCVGENSDPNASTLYRDPITSELVPIRLKDRKESYHFNPIPKGQRAKSNGECEVLMTTPKLNVFTYSFIEPPDLYGPLGNVMACSLGISAAGTKFAQELQIQSSYSSFKTWLNNEDYNISKINNAEQMDDLLAEFMKNNRKADQAGLRSFLLKNLDKTLPPTNIFTRNSGSVMDFLRFLGSSINPARGYTSGSWVLFGFIGAMGCMGSGKWFLWNVHKHGKEDGTKHFLRSLAWVENVAIKKLENGEHPDAIEFQKLIQVGTKQTSIKARGILTRTMVDLFNSNEEVWTNAPDDLKDGKFSHGPNLFGHFGQSYFEYLRMMPTVPNGSGDTFHVSIPQEFEPRAKHVCTVLRVSETELLKGRKGPPMFRDVGSRRDQDSLYRVTKKDELGIIPVNTPVIYIPDPNVIESDLPPVARVRLPYNVLDGNELIARRGQIVRIDSVFLAPDPNAELDCLFTNSD